MGGHVGKRFGIVPLFDPSAGSAVRQPPVRGRGNWVGAPGAHYDPETSTFYLVYRARDPKSRGYECRIAASSNGVIFDDIWALSRTSLGALSIERSALTCGLDGEWRLYISYVSAEDGRWRIGLMTSSEPDGFLVSSLRPLFTDQEDNIDGVKDPNVYLIGRMVHMVVSYAARIEVPAAKAGNKHTSGDIYNTGLTLSRTAAAVSGDGSAFEWLGDVSPGGGAEKSGWDHYCRRIGSILPIDGGGYLAFYDGSASVEENYEEKTGLAFTFDLQKYHRLGDECVLSSPWGSGSLRYVDVLPVGNELFYYYEIAMEDGSHELRVSVVERE